MLYQVIIPTVRSSTTTTPNTLGPEAFMSFTDIVSQYLSIEGILSFLNTVWTAYAVFAYIISIIFLVWYVYGSSGKKQIEDITAAEQAEKERLYQERFNKRPKNHRLEEMLAHIASENPSDWKLAIIEADIILDEILKSGGYAGDSLGERLRGISSGQLRSLDDAWQAHKVRNQIAHGGADFVLTRRLAEDTIKQYRTVFHEFGVM